MSVILRLTFTGDNQLGNWYTWLVLPLFLLTAVFWITRLNKGLRMFSAMVIVPVMQISWTLFSIVSGMLYFQEYKGFTPLKSVMFPIGVLVVFVGVFLLTQSASTKPASYQKMEEEAAARAAKQDSAKKAFGSRDATDFDVPVRAASIDSARSESTVVVVEQGAAARQLGDSLDDGDRQLPSMPPGPSVLPHASPDTLEDAASKAPDPQSMMDKVKGHLRNVQDRLNRDLLGVDPRAGLRLAMGLGDSGMPAISLFAMPTMLNYAIADNGSGRYSELVISSPKEGEFVTTCLSPVLEVTSKPVISSTQAGDGRSASEDAPQPAEGGSPVAARPPSAPSSPHLGQTGRRSLIDRAERAAKTGIEAIKRAPSNLQRAVREKQGYGSLHDDEETGLLEMAEPSDEPPPSTKRR
ncbi:hypothetical protein Vretifemale_8331 [Volvox reticuliferus]|nr:hypothetical protein Vretifemale_8331 [Volvox reticuliferus]